MAIALTLSQIVELSGGNPRRMKQFANEGMFLPIIEDRPSRAARRYSVSEAAIACIIAKLDAFRIAPSTLASLAEHLRTIYAVPDQYGFRTKQDALRFWGRETLLKLPKPDDPTVREKNALHFGLDEFPSGKPLGIETEEMHRISNWMTFEGAREGEESQMFLNIGDKGDWHYWLGEPIKDQEQDVYIVLNLHRILSVLR